MRAPIVLLACAALLAGCSPRTEPSGAVVEAPAVALASATPPGASIERAPSGPVDPLSGERLFAEALLLTSPGTRGRGSATEDERRVAEHLANELDLAGIEPPGEVRVQRFSFGSKTSQNVLGVIRSEGRAATPRESFVVLGAHYDHLGVSGGSTYFGADDNASGTAAVLGLARALVTRRAELARPVVIAFFGAEELGMKGSEAFVARGPVPKERVFAMVNVDMIGRPLADQAAVRPLLAALHIDPAASVGVDGLRGRAGFERVVREACASVGHRAVTIDDLPEALRPTIEGLSRERGDNWSFEREGIPALFFSSSESSDYHSPTDTIDTIDPDLMEIRARILLRTVIELSKLERP